MVQARAYTRRAAAALLGAALTSSLAACGTPGDAGAEDARDEASARVKARVGLLMCPASLGLVPFAERARAGETSYDYGVVYQRSYPEVTQALTEGMLDIAVLPPRVAAVLYNNVETPTPIAVLAIAGYSDWVLLSANRGVRRFANLVGRTLCLAGKSGTEGFTLRYLLELAALKGEVQLEYRDADAQVVAAVSEDVRMAGVVLAANAVQAIAQDTTLRRVADVATIWDELTEDGSACTGYVVVARRAFIDEHPEVVEDFLAEHAASSEAMRVDPITYAPLAVELGLSVSEEVAVGCTDEVRVACVTGPAMRAQLEGQLKVYAERYIPLIGGVLPGDDFYFGAEEPLATPEPQA